MTECTGEMKDAAALAAEEGAAAAAAQDAAAEIQGAQAAAERGPEPEPWAARAAACELLAFSLRFPVEEVAEVVQSGEWSQAAEELWAALGAPLADGWDEGAQAVDFHDMRAEATRLFVGTPTPECSPYEGFWRATDDGVQPLMFVNPHSMAVERFCRACGLGSPEGVNEPLDAIATEMELLQYLASLAAGIAEPVETAPELCKLPGGGPEEAYRQFASEHLLSFAPRMAAWLEENARTAFYRAVGRLLGSFVETPAAVGVSA